MTTTYFKAVRPDGFDFHTRTIDYGTAALSESRTVTHPRPTINDSDASFYFSVATVPTDCTGFAWSRDGGARLFEVEPTGDVWSPHADSMPNKRATTGLRIIRELPAWMLFGNEGERIISIIEQFDRLDPSTRQRLAGAWNSYYSIWWPTYSAVASDGRADRAGLDAARIALYYRLLGWRDDYAAYGAALALLLRPLVGTTFTQGEYDVLSRPWRSIVGEIHPDDKAVK